MWFSMSILHGTRHVARLFPYQSMFDWFSYGNDPTKDVVATEKDYFHRREWSFTIEDDIR
jgi:hypothetical protein